MLSRIEARTEFIGGTVQPPATRRAMWLLNHKTLLPAEVAIIRSLGYAVFVPKVVPEGPEYSSTFVTFDNDDGLNLPQAALGDLNSHNFYEQEWTDRITELVNGNFDIVITSVYSVPLRETLIKFDGGIVVRAFGRDSPRSYTKMVEYYGSDLLPAIAEMGNRFIFGQGYENLRTIESPTIAQRAHTLATTIPDSVWSCRGTWTGDGERAVLLLCPKISGNSYYGPIYEGLKALFHDVPHRIFGRQFIPHDDPAVLPYQSDEQLLDLYRKSPAFAYQSTEERHLHYSPIEAMIVGTPVLYRAGAMIDLLAGRPLPGRCVDAEEMKAKVVRLLRGDYQLSNAIRLSQDAVLEKFSISLATAQWDKALRELAAAPRRPAAARGDPCRVPPNPARVKTLKFYGQFVDPVDRFIFERYFPDLSAGGTFVECGAFDGQTECSCKFFEETMGWRGINLEPVPHIFEQLQKNRPASRNLNLGLSSENQTLDFDVVVHPEFGKYTTIGSVSHSDKLHQTLVDDGCTFEPIKIDVISWPELVAREEILAVDLFVLDVEGHEMEVLKGMRDSQVLPHVMCVEFGHVGIEKLRAEMETLGYAFDRTSFANAYFIRKDVLPLFAFRVAAAKAAAQW